MPAPPGPGGGARGGRGQRGPHRGPSPGGGGPGGDARPGREVPGGGGRCAAAPGAVGAAQDAATAHLPDVSIEVLQSSKQGLTREWCTPPGGCV